MLQSGISLFIDLQKTKIQSIMNLKGLLEQYSFEDIFPDFMELWKINASESAERLDKDGWKKRYHYIQSLNIKPSDYYILLVCRQEGCSPMIDMNCSVYSKVDSYLESPMSNILHGKKLWEWKYSLMKMF